MGIVTALRRLWRHGAFRRLLTLLLLSQAADGTLQVGMASYLLFSPQSQATAWSIAAVLALTLLPFTVIGPFVSPLLDRWPRRNIALYSDVTRAALAVAIGAIIFTGSTGGGWAVALFAALLVALSINRFMLAGLSAGLQHTVDADEYLTASSIVPTVGPLGVVIGAVLGFVVRFGFGDALGAHRADAVVFALAALMFVGSVVVCSTFERDALGPDRRAAGTTTGSSVGRVLVGLGEAFGHLKGRPIALMALGIMAATRLLFGLLSVAVILAARHLWHPSDQPAAALADLTLWGLATGAGFLLAAPFVPVCVRRLGLRRTAMALLVGGAVASLAVSLTTAKVPIYVASFAVGLAVQSFKICVDTIIQAHVDEGYKGRAFTFYDMGYNGAFVLAGVVGALVLPAHGLAPAPFVGIAAAYLACAAVVVWAAARWGAATFEKGTEDLTRR